MSSLLQCKLFFFIQKKILGFFILTNKNIPFNGSVSEQTNLLSEPAAMFSLFWVAQSDAPSDWRPGGLGFNPRRGRQHSFVEIDHEIFSTVILSLPLIQEGQLSVSGERMCTILVNRLKD